MANDRNNEQFGKQGEDKEFGEKKQQPAGEQGQQPEFGQKGQQPTGQQGQQPTGQQGQSSSGQADLGKSGDTDTLSDKRGFGQGTGGGQSGSGQPGTGGGNEGGGGFVGSQGSGSSDYLQQKGATGKPDFASQGQGAIEGQDQDVETGQRRNPDSDKKGEKGA